ncbi:DUF3325 family protein [Pseudomonas sp.]|uniref:DUF3325 family protein n=1 Tax=Pseudomonas sp. TaxID=306 RepID=UPI00356A0C20
MLDLLCATGLLMLQLFTLGCLALSQDKHWRTLMEQTRLPPKQRLQWLGGAGLLTGSILAMSLYGWGFGILIWLLSLPLGGYVVTFALALTLSARQSR